MFASSWSAPPHPGNGGEGLDCTAGEYKTPCEASEGESFLVESSCGEAEGVSVAGATEVSFLPADSSSNATGNSMGAGLLMGDDSASGGDRGRDLGSVSCPISVSVSSVLLDSSSGGKSVESGMAVSGVGSEAATSTFCQFWLARDSLMSAAN